MNTTKTEYHITDEATGLRHPVEVEVNTHTISIYVPGHAEPVSIEVFDGDARALVTGNIVQIDDDIMIALDKE